MSSENTTGKEATPAPDVTDEGGHAPEEKKKRKSAPLHLVAPPSTS